jgi:hypothetical protein
MVFRLKMHKFDGVNSFLAAVARAISVRTMRSRNIVGLCAVFDAATRIWVR